VTWFCCFCAVPKELNDYTSSLLDLLLLQYIPRFAFLSINPLGKCFALRSVYVCLIIEVGCRHVYVYVSIIRALISGCVSVRFRSARIWGAGW